MMRALGFGVLTGIVLATVTVSLMLALADRPAPQAPAGVVVEQAHG